MRVKIGETWFEVTVDTPIVLELNEQDRKAIADMDPKADKIAFIDDNDPIIVLGREAIFHYMEEGAVGDNGYICFNNGPGAWFWSPEPEELVHELSEGIRPATPLEKSFMQQHGNQWPKDW